MATALAIAGQQTIIPLLTGFKPDEESSWVKLQCDVNVSNMANPRYECKKDSSTKVQQAGY